MPISDQEVLGVDLLACSSSDTLRDVPIKKRHFMLARSPSLPSHVSSSLPESSVSETFSPPTSATTFTRKDPCEPRLESITRNNFNASPEHEHVPRPDHQGQVKESNFDNVCTLQPATVGTQLFSENEPFELPVKESCAERKHVQLAFKGPLGLPEVGQISKFTPTKQDKPDSHLCNPSSSVREQHLQSKCNNAESKVESPPLCLNRSNWDLNTTMDSWQDLPSDSAQNNATSGIENERPRLGPVQRPHEEPDGADAMVGKLMLGVSVGSSSSPSIAMNEGNNAETCLNLQLKPSSMAESFFKWGSSRPLGKDSIQGMPLLSLSVKPSSPSCNPTPIACRAVKAEPYEGSSQKDSHNIDISAQKSVVRHVKSEPCERQEISERIHPSVLNSASSGALKSEALADRSQGFLRQDNSRLLTTQSTEMPLDGAERASKNNESPDPNPSTVTQASKNNESPDPNRSIGTQASTPHNNEITRGGEMLMCTGIPQYGKVIATESSDLVHESLVSEEKKKPNLFEGASKIVGLASTPSIPSVTDVKEHVASNVKSGVVASADELLEDSNVKSKVAEGSGEKTEPSAEALGVPCDHERESSHSHEYEDGELRDLVLHGTVEGPCEESEGKQVEAADSTCPIDGPVEVPPCINLKEGNIVHSEESMIHDTVRHESGASTITDTVLAACSGIRKLGKTIRKIPRAHMKDKGPERKPTSERALSARTVTKGYHDDVSSDKATLSEKESPVKDDADKEIQGSGPRIIDLKTAPDGDGKHFPGRLISLPVEKERFIERSLGRGEKSRSRRMRDDKSRYRSQNFDRTRNRDQPVGRRGLDMMLNRNRMENQVNAMPYERNRDNEHGFEQVDSSTNFQYASNGSTGRMARTLMDDELQNISRMTFRGRFPRGRGRMPAGNQMARHPSKDVSPDRYAWRDVPDFELRAHKERLMRTLPDDRVGPLVYERRSLSPPMCRERSISPIQRRAPMEFPPICPESSPRSQARQIQWSPPRRSRGGFNGAPELLRRRAIRNDEMRFTEDMNVTRNAPHYISRLPDDAGDIGPSRERDFPRLLRGGMQRNIRRFDTIDPREFPEEFYPPPVLHDQCGELDGNVECDERHERRPLGPGRPFRQRRVLSDDVDESFHSHIDTGPPGPFRFFHEENDGFPERGGPRDFEGHIRNRLGGRPRGIEEEEDNYRYRGDPGWRDVGVTDARMKRRRIERQ